MRLTDGHPSADDITPFNLSLGYAFFCYGKSLYSKILEKCFLFILNFLDVLQVAYVYQEERVSVVCGGLAPHEAISFIMKQRKLTLRYIQYVIIYCVSTLYRFYAVYSNTFLSAWQALILTKYSHKEIVQYFKIEKSLLLLSAKFIPDVISFENRFIISYLNILETFFREQIIKLK